MYGRIVDRICGAGVEMLVTGGVRTFSETGVKLVGDVGDNGGEGSCWLVDRESFFTNLRGRRASAGLGGGL